MFYFCVFPSVPRQRTTYIFAGPYSAWWRHQMEHFPRYWPFVWEIHRSPVNSPHKGQWRGALMFSLICAWINGWVNNCEVGDLRSHRANYDFIVMKYVGPTHIQSSAADYWIIFMQLPGTFDKSNLVQKTIPTILYHLVNHTPGPLTVIVTHVSRFSEFWRLKLFYICVTWPANRNVSWDLW